MNKKLLIIILSAIGGLTVLAGLCIAIQRYIAINSESPVDGFYDNLDEYFDE